MAALEPDSTLPGSPDHMEIDNDSSGNLTPVPDVLLPQRESLEAAEALISTLSSDLLLLIERSEVVVAATRDASRYVRPRTRSNTGGDDPAALDAARQAS